MALVKVRLAGGEILTSSVTQEAAEDLEFAVGSAVTVQITSTEVSLGVE